MPVGKHQDPNTTITFPSSSSTGRESTASTHPSSDREKQLLPKPPTTVGKTISCRHVPHDAIEKSARLFPCATAEKSGGRGSWVLAPNWVNPVARAPRPWISSCPWATAANRCIKLTSDWLTCKSEDIIIKKEVVTNGRPSEAFILHNAT